MSYGAYPPYGRKLPFFLSPSLTHTYTVTVTQTLVHNPAIFFNSQSTNN